MRIFVRVTFAPQIKVHKGMTLHLGRHQWIDILRRNELIKIIGRVSVLSAISLSEISSGIKKVTIPSGKGIFKHLYKAKFDFLLSLYRYLSQLYSFITKEDLN